MPELLEAGPFEAHDGEGRLLFSDAVVRLPAGRAVGLTGTSGSGKSTLLRSVVGLGRDGQEVTRRLGDDLYPRSRLPAWRSKVTLMAQDAPVVPGSLLDNIELPYRLRVGGRRTVDGDAARSLLHEVGLGSIPLERDVATLSGGERHRLALVRGLLWDPPVLLADEPLSGLDERTAATCFELLLAFAHRPGHGLLAVLHHAELADRLDGTIHLADGRLGGP